MVITNRLNGGWLLARGTVDFIAALVHSK